MFSVSLRHRTHGPGVPRTAGPEKEATMQEGEPHLAQLPLSGTLQESHPPSAQPRRWEAVSAADIMVPLHLWLLWPPLALLPAESFNSDLN